MSVNEMLMAAAGSAGGAKEYVEDVFSTWLYTGNGSTQTITNNIDLSSKGGFVWVKQRNSTSPQFGNVLFDTERGVSKYLYTDFSSGEETWNNLGVTAFNADGFTVKDNIDYGVNANTNTYASWTFRKAKKFFDVVTYSGTGVNRTISHNLGSVPGMIIIKRRNSGADWQVYHRSLANTEYLVLNSIAAKATGTTRWNSTTPTSTEFSLGTDTTVNASGGTYVAYLFAHNAGGFGAAGTDNIISCGSYTTDGSGNATVNLGFEPQWIIRKEASTSGNWQIYDSMRGLTVTNNLYLQAQASDAEISEESIYMLPSATGFSITGVNPSVTYIYMAIRRPMKTPTTGTEVFATQATRGATNGTATQNAYTSNFPVDLLLQGARAGASSNATAYDRLRNPTQTLVTSSTGAEGTGAVFRLDDMDGVYTTSSLSSTSNFCGWMFKRAPGFFDIVCYTGTGTNTTVTHNLGVVPEMMIVKRRTGGTGNWLVYHTATGNTDVQYLNLTDPATAVSAIWNNTSPTSTAFSVGTSGAINASGSTYVAYLFATLAGVSKVGSYTGNGTNQTINCGFSAGARFVLIKRSNDDGDWCVFDTARGIVSGNDPFLQLNSTAVEVTNEDAVDPANSGFIVNQTTENLNVNNATYLFLAIA